MDNAVKPVIPDSCPTKPLCNNVCQLNVQKPASHTGGWMCNQH